MAELIELSAEVSMLGKLSGLHIEGLQTVRTINIQIVDNELVFAGENGVRRRTVMQFVYFFLTNQWVNLLNYDFDTVSVVVDSKPHEFSRETIAALAAIAQNQALASTSLLRSIKTALDSPASPTPDNCHEVAHQSGPEFLLSIAGIFASEPSTASENVESLVAELILEKHGKTAHGLSD